jgi:hypothetical protein
MVGKRRSSVWGFACLFFSISAQKAGNPIGRLAPEVGILDGISWDPIERNLVLLFFSGESFQNV